MRPLNLDNSPCSPISSNCVIWAGNNIPCINLCTGDTVSDVVFKLATELCTIIDYLNVSSYDLACFNLASCKPNNFQELLQFLINRICALENIDVAVIRPSTSTAAVANKSAVVTDYLLTAASCFGGGTVTIVDYVDQIANRICTIVTEISIINSGINSLNVRVTTLESTPVPTFVIPSFILQCNIGTIIPVLAAGTTQDIDIVISRFINEEWCPYKAVFDTFPNLSNAVLSQCILGTDDSEALRFTSPGTQMQVAYPSYVASPITLANAINNLWLALCDVRNGGTELTTITAGDNITVTPVVTIVGSDQVTDYTIDGKDTIVVAGDNTVVTPTGPVAGVTTYTIDTKEAIVVGADDIVVTPLALGLGVTQYTVSRPKLNFYEEVIGEVQVALSAVPSVSTYHFPTGYNVLSYTNTSGVAKTFAVHVSYEVANTSGMSIFLQNDEIANWVDGAIIKTVLAVDTIEYECYGGRVEILGSIYDSPAPIPSAVNLTTAEKVITNISLTPVEFRFGSGLSANTLSIFKMVTLNNNESVSLKFKTLSNTTNSILFKAQIFIQEL